MADRSIVPIERIARGILVLRGERVMLDADLAALYGVATKALNQAVKRNRGRFPADFMFQLRKAEKAYVVTNCDHLGSLRFSPSLPYAFTEHGAIMAANVLNSDRAVAASVLVVRAFVSLRKVAASHADLTRKVDELENKYDSQFKVVFNAIRQLMQPAPERRESLGFHAVREQRRSDSARSESDSRTMRLRRGRKAKGGA